MLDIFRQDAFSVIALTDAINNIPFVPGRVGQLGLFRESGVPVTTIVIEQKNNVLTLLSPSPRGAPGQTIDKKQRDVRSVVIPHFELLDAVMADEVQGVRAFGSETEVETVFGRINERMGEHTPSFDATLEYGRIGAVKGLVTYADSSTLDLFNLFGVSQESEIDFDLDNASPASGVVRGKCDAAVRLIAKNLGGVPYTGVYAFAGDTFWDQLVAHSETRDTYKYQEGAALREGTAFTTFRYGGITWENYRGAVGSTAFVDPLKAHIFPLGVPNLFRTYFGPADYMETVNTVGLPRYAKQIVMDNGKGVRLEMQSNPLSLCTRPKTLLKAKNT